jgi:hypothetical protein
MICQPCDDLNYFYAANKISNYKSKTKLAIANMVVTHNCYDNMAGKSDTDKTPGDKSTKNKVKKGVNATIPQVDWDLLSSNQCLLRAIDSSPGHIIRQPTNCE